MDNLIPPLTSTLPNISGPENEITGTVTDLPEEVQIALKPGQSYLLKILMTEDSLSLAAENEVPAEIDIEGKKVPLNIKLDKPIKLPEKQENNIQIKVSSINDAGQADVKIQAINNEKISRYLQRVAVAESLGESFSLSNKIPEAVVSDKSLQSSNFIENTSQQTTSKAENIKTSLMPEIKPQTEIKTEASVVFDVAKNKNISEFHPLKIGQMLKDLTVKLHLPSDVGKLLDENFQQAEIKVNLHLEDLSRLDNQIAEKPIQNTLDRIELILKNFSDNINKQKPQVSDVEHFIYQIKNELLPLKNTLMTGTAFSNADNKLLALRTTIGNFLPDKILKVENLSNVTLEVTDIKFPEKVSPEHLKELNTSHQLTQNLPSILDIFKDFLSSQIQPQSEMDKLLDIFKTLHKTGHEDLAQKIMQKFPQAEGPLLENIFHFVKGAGRHNPELWLGKEIVEELQNLGKDGQEVSVRLTDFMSSSVRDTGSWKIINLPIINGEQLSKIRLAIKNLQDGENKKEELRYKKAARFVVDTIFTNLGSFQFDGFSFVKERQFDLIIRTSKNIDDDLKSNIFRIFKMTLNNLHYAGTIKINVKENFIKICEDESKSETLKQGLYV